MIFSRFLRPCWGWQSLFLSNTEALTIPLLTTGTDTRAFA